MIKAKVVLVPFPFDDLSRTKVRPAICLTEPLGRYRHIVVAFVISRIPVELLETDLALDSSQADFAATGLQITSTLRLHRLMTISTGRILRELGELSPRIELNVRGRLTKLFGIG